jgi:hypothetical protein
VKIEVGLVGLRYIRLGLAKLRRRFGELHFDDLGFWKDWAAVTW